MVDLKRRSPEAKRAYFEGYLAALKAAVVITIKSDITDYDITQEINKFIELTETSLRALGEE